MPLLDVELGIPSGAAAALRRAGAPVSPRVPVRAIIDTGAGRTAIGPGYAGQLGLAAIGSVPIETSSTNARAYPTFDIRIVLPSGGEFEVEAVEMPNLGVQRPYQCLIGRDILQHMRVTYDGPAGSCILAY